MRISLSRLFKTSSGPVLVAAGLALAATPAVSAAPDISGSWRTPAGAVIRISDCGKEPCGRIVDFPAPKGYTVKTTPDSNNKDESKRGRKLLGLKVLWRMQPGGGGWKGRVYDPRRGFSANATVRKASASALVVEGCVRVVFNICEKETWTRVD